MYKLILLSTLSVACSSCVQLSMFQDAKTVGKGNITVGGSFSAYIAPEFDEGNGIVIPFAEGNLSYGLTEKLDIQVGLSQSASLLLSPKYQILGDNKSKFAVALNPGIELLNTFDREFVLLPNLSFISSIHFNDRLSIFIEPKYIIELDELENTILYGYSVGLKYSVLNKIDLSLGFSHFQIVDDADKLYKPGLGIRYNFSSN